MGVQSSLFIVTKRAVQSSLFIVTKVGIVIAINRSITCQSCDHHVDISHRKSTYFQATPCMSNRQTVLPNDVRVERSLCSSTPHSYTTARKPDNRQIPENTLVKRFAEVVQIALEFSERCRLTEIRFFFESLLEVDNIVQYIKLSLLNCIQL